MALADLFGWTRRRDRPREPAGSDHGATPIAEAPRRGRVRVAGVVSGVTAGAPAGSPALEVTLTDDTGRAVARFTGRTEIPGITPGRLLLLEGMARNEAGALVLRNPSYRLLD